VNDTLFFALTAGMVAAFNPCGFALLPAYLALLLSRTDTQRAPVGRALAASAAMTAGFVAVFGAFGLVVVPLAISLGEYLSWATVVVGVLLVGLGVWLLSGRELLLRLPRMRGAAPTGGPASMVLYGVAYAVASLSCTIAPFLAVTTSTFRSESILAGIAVFVAYGLGMGCVVAVLAVAVALAQEGLVRRLRRVMPYVNRVSGVLLVPAGAYVIYYGLYEVRVARGGDLEDPIVSGFTRVQGAAADVIDGLGPTVIAGILAALVVLGGVLGAMRVNRARSHRSAGD